MSVPNSKPSALSYQDNLVFNQLMTEMNPVIAYQLSEKRNVFNFFLRLINSKWGGSTPFFAADGKIISASRGSSFLQARIQSRSTPTPGVIRLAFESSVDAARVGDRVFYGNSFERMGLVKAAVNGSGGYIDILPLYDYTFSGSDFPVGAVVGIYGDNSLNFVSGQKDRRFHNPTLDYNYTSTVRDGYWVARREKGSTRVTTNGAQPSVFTKNGYWYNDMQVQMFRNLELSLEIDRRISERSKTVYADGERTTNGGFRWAVKNRGGDYFGFATPLTESVINNWIGGITDKLIGSSEPLLMFTGRGFRKALFDFYRDAIKYTGVLNTFGGHDVKSFNFKTFQVPGIMRDIVIIEDPLLDSVNVFGDRCTIPGYEQYTKAQMTAYIMSDSQIETTDGGYAPRFKQWHWGESEYLLGELSGMDKAAFLSNPADAEAMIKANPLSVSILTDATSVGVLTDSGIDGYGYGCGWIEPII